eukprot:Rmarinus@m.23374
MKAEFVLLVLALALPCVLAGSIKDESFTRYDSPDTLCDTGSKLAMDDRSYVCVVVNLHTVNASVNATADASGSGTGGGSSAETNAFAPGVTVFRPKVDEFSLLELHSNTSRELRMQNDHQGLGTVQVAVGTRMSPPRRFSYESTKAVGFWTIVVDLKDGEVDSVLWDEGCFTCSDDECLDDNCLLDTCDHLDDGADNSNRDQCNVKIYLAWTGTDKDGNIMLSEGFTFSKFNAYAVDGFWDDAATKAKTTYDSASETYEKNKDIGNDVGDVVDDGDDVIDG